MHQRRDRHPFNNNNRPITHYNTHDFEHHQHFRRNINHPRGNRMLEESTYASALRGSKTPTHSIFVKNLPRDCSKQELMHAFSKYGEIYSCAVVKRGNNRYTTTPTTQSSLPTTFKAFGFVNFLSKDAQEFAVRESGEIRIRDNMIECEISTTTTVVYIGNIPIETPDDTVRYHVRKFGGPYQALDVRHGHCFVIYDSYYNAEKAIKKLQGTKIDDEVIWVSVASETKAKMLAGFCERPQSRTLHIAGIGSISEHELKTHFKPYGIILAVRVPRDLQTRINKGYAFVEFSNSGDAELAKRAEDGKTFSSTDIMNISWCHGEGANSRRIRGQLQRYDSTGGSGGGGGGRGPMSVRRYDSYERHNHRHSRFMHHHQTQVHPSYHHQPYMQLSPVHTQISSVPYFGGGGGGGGYVDSRRSPSRHHGYHRGFAPPLQMELPGHPGKLVPVIPVSQYMHQQSTFFQIPPISRRSNFSSTHPHPHSIRIPVNYNNNHTNMYEHYHQRHHHRHRSSRHSRHTHHQRTEHSSHHSRRRSSKDIPINELKHESGHMQQMTHSRSRSRSKKGRKHHRHKHHSDRGFFHKHRSHRSNDRRRAVSEGLNGVHGSGMGGEHAKHDRKSCSSSNSSETDVQSRSLSSTKSQSHVSKISPHHSLSLHARKRRRIGRDCSKSRSGSSGGTHSESENHSRFSVTPLITHSTTVTSLVVVGGKGDKVEDRSKSEENVVGMCVKNGVGDSVGDIEVGDEKDIEISVVGDGRKMDVDMDMEKNDAIGDGGMNVEMKSADDDVLVVKSAVLLGSDEVVGDDKDVKIEKI